METIKITFTIKKPDTELMIMCNSEKNISKTNFIKKREEIMQKNTADIDNKTRDRQKTRK